MSRSLRVAALLLPMVAGLYAVPTNAAPGDQRPTAIHLTQDETIAVAVSRPVSLTSSSLLPSAGHFAALYQQHARMGFVRVSDSSLGVTPATLSLTAAKNPQGGGADLVPLSLRPGRRYKLAVAIDGPATLTLPEGVDVVSRQAAHYRARFQERPLAEVPGAAAVGSVANRVGARNISSVGVAILWNAVPADGSYVIGACYSAQPITTCYPDDSGTHWTDDEFMVNPNGTTAERVVVGESYRSPHATDPYIAGTAAAPATSPFLSAILLAFGMDA